MQSRHLQCFLSKIWRGGVACSKSGVCSMALSAPGSADAATCALFAVSANPGFGPAGRKMKAWHPQSFRTAVHSSEGLLANAPAPRCCGRLWYAVEWWICVLTFIIIFIYFQWLQHLQNQHPCQLFSRPSKLFLWLHIVHVQGAV